MTCKIGYEGALREAPDPEIETGNVTETIFSGKPRRMLDGSLRRQMAGTKRKWKLRWERLNQAEKDNLACELAKPGILVWEPRVVVP